MRKPVEIRPRKMHPEFGIVVDHAEYGLGCPDCGWNAHAGPCTTYTCRTCGVDCGESGCSLHGGPPHENTTERITTTINEAP